MLAEVVSAGARATWPQALVEHCRGALGVAGVGLTLTDTDGLIAVAAATPGLARTGEELQFELGEGPCTEATTTGWVVRAPDLAVDPRWALYSREAGLAGIRAESCVPLTVGAVRVGVLTVYCDEVGDLDPAAWATVRVHAEAATAVLLLSKQDAADDVAEYAGAAADLTDIRPVVHQAAGMVAIQLDVDLTDALLRLRAHAFSAGRTLRDVAADVEARRLVFDHSTAGATERTAPTGQPPGADQTSPRTRDDR